MGKVIWFIVVLCMPYVVNANEFMFKHLEVKDGLSNNQVLDIFKDSEGFVWFATASGLNRYDGNQVTIFRSSEADPHSLPDNYVEGIQEDNEGNLWLKTRSGYAIYHPETETFNRDVRAWLWEVGIDGHPALVYIDHNKNLWFYVADKGCFLYMPESQLLYPLLFDAQQLPQGRITDIKECKEGVLLVYDNGLLVCLDENTNKVKWQQEDIVKEAGGKSGIFTLFVDSDGDIWIYSPFGIWAYNAGQKKWQSHLCNLITRQSSAMVHAVAQDKQGRIWIGKELEGIDLLDKETGEVKQLRNRVGYERSLQDNTVRVLYQDANEIMWVGTDKKGVSYYNESIFKFSIEHVGDITCMEEDKNGYVWLGTNGDGLIYWNAMTGERTAFAATGNDLGGKAISCLLKSADGKLWIGVSDNGLYCYDKGRITRYKSIKGQKNALAQDNVSALAEDKEGLVWIGTQGGGVQSLNPKTGAFTAYNMATVGLLSDKISSLSIGKGDLLWMGTAEGVSALDLETKKVTNLKGTKSGKEHFSNQHISYVYEDSRGLVWAGTREGLNIYNPKTDELYILSAEQGLSSSIISGIVEDDNKNIWVATARGITHIVPTCDGKAGRYSFRNYVYNEKDGLQNCEFNKHSVKKLWNGEILMGGVYGINRFLPDEIMYNKLLPKVLFTQFLLFNEEVKVGAKYGDRLLLDKALNRVGRIELDYAQNIFSIRFASDNYILPGKMKYAYKLEGFTDEWLTTSVGEVTYTNLDPGTYTLKVKAINSDGYSGDEEASLKIIVRAPFWRSVWAYILYGLLVIAALIAGRYLILRSERKKFEMQQAELEMRKNEEMNEMRLKLLADSGLEVHSEGEEKEEAVAMASPAGREEGEAQVYRETPVAQDIPVDWETPAYEKPQLQQDSYTGEEQQEEPAEEKNHIITIEGLDEEIRRLEAGETENEENEIVTLTAIGPQRATVIQLTEEGDNEFTVEIVPPEELPEVVTTVNKGKKSIIAPVSLAADELVPGEAALSSMDEKLLDRAVKYVENNLSRSDFSVEELSRELGISRVHLYKKLSAITGKTPIEFIRAIRLKRAALLLLESGQNVSEVAFQVGFNNPKYFSKYFKEEFGALPSVYQANGGKC